MSRKKYMMVTGLLSLTLISGVFVTKSLGANVQPGSTADPLVTKSYVDDKINQAMTGNTNNTTKVNTQEIVTDVLAQIEYLYGKQLRGEGEGGAQSSVSYAPVNASTGQIILGHEGTEIILRSGSAVSYCPGDNGLVNITSGKDMGNGAKITSNHLLIVPRNDGRGVKVTNDAWFMIKGGYDILEN